MGVNIQLSNKHESVFEQILPPTEFKSNENLQEAIKIMKVAYGAFKEKGIISTDIQKAISEIESSKVGKAEFGIGYADKKNKTMVYSVKLESEDGVKILTLQVRGGFIELSLLKNGNLSEIIQDEHGEVTHQKMKQV